jgi:hypothetical protein
MGRVEIMLNLPKKEKGGVDLNILASQTLTVQMSPKLNPVPSVMPGVALYTRGTMRAVSFLITSYLK